MLTYTATVSYKRSSHAQSCIIERKILSREILRTEHLDRLKIEYLCIGKDYGKAYNYGQNFSNFLRKFTELSYQVMFTEIE